MIILVTKNGTREKFTLKSTSINRISRINMYSIRYFYYVQFIVYMLDLFYWIYLETK